MSASGLIDAIGVAGTLLTAIGFTQSNLPAEQNEGATVKIKAGLAGLGENAELGGSINRIYAFDENGGYGGQVGGCDVDSGGICEKTVDQSVGGRRAGYISVANNRDATCIAWIAVTQQDGSDGGVWTGDNGRCCGERWYASTEPAGVLENGDEYIPGCTFLDGDHTNDIVNAALNFDVGAFYKDRAEDIADNQECETYDHETCQYTIYGPDNAPLSPPIKRSDPATRPEWMTDSLIMSNWTTQYAKDLCGSQTSWGPDFVDSHGEFCDMDTKTLMPLCATQDVDGCVEFDESTRTVNRRMSVARRAANVVHKSYRQVQKWGRGQ